MNLPWTPELGRFQGLLVVNPTNWYRYEDAHNDMFQAITQVTSEHLGVAEKNGFDRCGCEVCAILLPALEQAEKKP